jgi:lipid-binding SYLF domain-containing protein
MRMLTIVVAAAMFAQSAPEKSATEKRIGESVAVLEEIMGARDRAIPQDLLDQSRCAVVVPGVKKGGFVLAAKFGRGFAVCRNDDGKGWGKPWGVRVEGGSVGFQIGGSETDVVMLVMNERGMQRLKGNKFTVGGDASVAAGPVGRETTAQTDATMRAEILSWSRSRGVFAGIALNGATLRPDNEANSGLTARPELADPLVSLLNKYSSRRTK